MNECKIWRRKPLKKVTTMVASEEVAKFIAIVALSETVALEIALWERTRWQIWEVRWFYPWTDKYLETKHWIHDAVSVWIGMNPWTLKIHQESKKCWLVAGRYVWRSWWAGLFVSRTWKIINEVVSEQDTYPMKTCATVTALKHIRGDGTMSWSGNVWGVCVTDRGGWGLWQWAGASRPT